MIGFVLNGREDAQRQATVHAEAAAGSATPMRLALQAAQAAAARGEVPVGAVILHEDGRVLALTGNRTEELKDASAHAELLALRAAAAALNTSRLERCDLWVTLEPCPMCAAAAGLFRVRRIYFGAYDPKGGGIEHGPRIPETARNLHRPEIVGGVFETEAAGLLRAFFAERRG